MGGIFIIATHSPILLAFPDSQILSFDGDTLTEILYRETTSLSVVFSLLELSGELPSQIVPTIVLTQFDSLSCAE
jgi:predicted ATPase